MKAFNLYNSNNITESLEMGCLRMHSCESYAVSEVVGIVTVLLIVTGGISVVLFWGVPYMEDKKASVSLDSAVLQLDAMSRIVDELFREGVNSSKTMNFQADSGEVYMDEMSERFVFYCSVFTGYWARGEDPFVFDVDGFDDENEKNFTINVSRAPGWMIPEVTLNFTFTRLNDSLNDTDEKSVQVGGSRIEVTCNDFSLAGAVRIDIRTPNPEPPPLYVDCGCIWLFDVGSIIYQKPSTSGLHMVIVENGGVVKVSGGGGGYVCSEPTYWNKELLDSRSMVTLRFIQTVPDYDTGVYSIGGSGALKVKFFVKVVNSSVLEIRRPIDYSFNMRIYGDEAAVAAWGFYYKYRMGFEEDPYDPDVLLLNLGDIESSGGVFPLFSLNYAICEIGMGVRD